MAKISEKGIIAKKVGMTRMVDGNGSIIPVTLLKIENQKVTKILTPERDGYHAIQVGYYPKAEKNLTKADLGRLRKNQVTDNFARFVEFRTQGATSLEIGTVLTADIFKDVQSVDVTGTSKGKGFQGAIKRWNSAIGRMTHGSDYHRRPGSLGMRATPGRVFKNKPGPGHLGDEVNTICNLRVVDVDLENNVIALKGSVPGHENGFVELRPTNRK